MRRRFHKVYPYALVVLANWVGAYVAVTQCDEAADRVADDTATVAYWNDVDGCIRGNEAVRSPLHRWFKGYVRDERDETDDLPLLNVAQQIRGDFVKQRCLRVVVQPPGARDYVEPEDRPGYEPPPKLPPPRDPVRQYGR